MKAIDIINIMNRWAPLYLIDSWDSTGFQIGDPNKDIKKILVSLDLDREVFEKAKKENIDMIITHHPLLFKPMAKITKEDYKGRLVYDLIKEDIVVYNAHSNLDLAIGGINDTLASLLNLRDIEVLEKVYEEKLYKIVVFVPRTHVEEVRNALGEAKAGWIGNYSHCTYNIDGIGTFMPREGTNPFIGSLNKLEKVEETRIETIVEKRNLNRVLNEMIKVHPYEEVAYDIYPLENTGAQYGYGRVGNIEEIPLNRFLDKIKKELRLDKLRVYGDIDRKIKRVALCGGSGSDFIKSAYYKGADLYLTGDIKYHDGQLAKELGLLLVDGNHFDTEKIILPVVKEKLLQNIEEDIDIILYEKSTAPFVIY